MYTLKMTNTRIALALCCLGLIFILEACSGDDTPVVPDENGVVDPENNPDKEEKEVLSPQIGMNPGNPEVYMRLGDTLHLHAENLNEAVYEEEWILDGTVISASGAFEFVPGHTGNHVVGYRAYNTSGEFRSEFYIEVGMKIRPVTDSSNAYVTELFDYRPAPGQFINKNPGNLESAEGILGKRGLVSLGGWGGTIILGFDHTVINRSGEKDLAIYGNAMPNFAEPGVIYVMPDANGNGLPDDTWYEIKGSAHGLPGTVSGYEVTYFRPEDPAADVPWEDNMGNSGVIATNTFHRQPYYPEWIEEDSYTFKGTLLPSVNIDMSNPSYITSTPFEYGYADNTPGGDKIDITDAVDGDGNPVQLEGIDFIMIQTGIQANMGWLGELSTEVAGVADLIMAE